MNYRTKLLKICVVTGTRAECYLLQWVMQAIQDDRFGTPIDRNWYAFITRIWFNLRVN